MIMPTDRKKRAYKLYSLGRLVFDEAALVAVVLWLLPRFGINISIWLLIVFMAAWAVYSAVYSCLTSMLVGKVIVRASAVGPEALIGVKCYVRVGTELWRACSMGEGIEIGTEVIIVGINRLTLLVKPSTGTSFDEGLHPDQRLV